MESRHFFLLINAVGIVFVPMGCVGIRLAFGLVGWMLFAIIALCATLIPLVFLLQLLWSLLIPKGRSIDWVLLVPWVLEVALWWAAAGLISDFVDVGAASTSPFTGALWGEDDWLFGVGMGYWMGVSALILTVLWMVGVVWIRLRAGGLSKATPTE